MLSGQDFYAKDGDIFDSSNDIKSLMGHVKFGKWMDTIKYELLCLRAMKDYNF